MNVIDQSITFDNEIKKTLDIGTWFVKLLLLIFSCLLILLIFHDYPALSMVLIDACFCCFLCSLFHQKWRFLFLLHPLIIVVLSLGYDHSFVHLGDGDNYYSLVTNTLSFYTGGVSLSEILVGAALSGQLLNTFKTLSLGVFPVFFVPDYLYGWCDDHIYYLWQSTMHVMCSTVCVVLSKVWSVMRDDYLFFMALFALISPSFFELGVAPTRHYVTFFSIWLFYVSFMSIIHKFTMTRILWASFAVVLIIISKIAYLAPITIFALYCVIDDQASTAIKKLYFFMIVVILGFLMMPFFSHLAGSYLSETAQTGAATFAWLIKIPIIGWIWKFVYALLSPFPWRNATEIITTTYGGNWLFLLLHIGSSLLGLYFLFRLMIYSKRLFVAHPDVKKPVIYGGILSTSILFGSIGFHGYLAIFFPFFAPLFAIKTYSIRAYVPFFAALVAEMLYFMLTYS